MVTLRRAGWLDCWFLWRVRNHASTRHWMTDTAPISLRVHLRWFAHVKRRADIVVLVAIHPNTGQRLGFVRLTLEPNATSDISYAVATRWRGLGFGTLIVVAALREARALGVRRMVAQVRVENRRSMRAFAACRFVDVTHTAQDSAYRWLERQC